MNNIINCPNCGAPIDNSRTSCEYCETPYDNKTDKIEQFIRLALLKQEIDKLKFYAAQVQQNDYLYGKLADSCQAYTPNYLSNLTVNTVCPWNPLK